MDYVLLFFIGVVATTLGTLAGGGGLITMPAMMLLGFPIHAIIGATKISNSTSSFTTFLTVWIKKQITWHESWWIFPISLTGGIVGGLIATHLSDNQLSTVALVLLLTAFVISFKSSTSFDGSETLTPSKKAMTGLWCIGLYDGMFGPGQGTFLLYLFQYLNISYVRAIGFVRFAIFSSGLGASFSFLLAGHIVWPMVFALLAGSLTGAQLGIQIAEKLSPQHVKLLLRFVIGALLAQLTYQLILTK